MKHLPVFHTKGEATHTTAISAICALGKGLPIEFVKRFDAKVYETDLWIYKSMDSNIKIHSSKNGYVNRTIFLEWFLTTFVPKAREMVNTELGHSVYDDSKPLLLILDGASPHVDIHFVSEAIKHNVILLLLPSHTSSHLQVGLKS